MANASDELLYREWDKHWVEEEKMTLVGKVLCPIRINSMKNVIEQLDISSALDAGCGVGHLLKIFNEMGIARYVGLDVSSRAVAICHQKGLNAKLGRLESEEEHYDLVAAEGMLEHFVNFEPFADHLMRGSRKFEKMLLLK